MAKRRRLKKSAKIILDLFTAACLCVAVFSGYKLYGEMKEYSEGKNAYDSIRKERDAFAEGIDEDEIRREIFSKMKKENPDFTGWIYLEDSAIDYPFVHTDNNDFYLYHLFSGEYNRSGCVFMDMDNAADFSDRNTILYAHHMRNGTMFHDVVNYEKQEYYDTHKVIQIDTMEASYDLYPVAGIYTTGTSDYLQIDFEDDEDFLDYADMFLENSTFKSEETITAEDRIVLLSTCAYNVRDGRYALICKLEKR